MVASSHSEQPTSTPTRHRQDYTSPSAYLNEGYLSPSTPLASETMAYDGPQGGDVDYEFAYGDFTEESELFLPMEPVHSAPLDHSTPSGPTRPEQDRTPVLVKMDQIPPTSLPRRDDATIRASSPLMSPFKPFHQQQQQATGMMYPPEPPLHPQQHLQQQQQHPQFIDPAMTFYQNPAYAYPEGSPVDPSHSAYMPPQPHFVQMYPPMGYVVPGYYAPPAYPYPAHPRSRAASPSSSVSSAAVSLTRSGSTSSELRPTRPKVKLTHDDKRRIVEIARENTSLRQEDIARQYGVDRSTISKILLSSHRWTGPPEPPTSSAPKPSKAAGGRFPAIEDRMHEWMDGQIAAGVDIRDNIARDRAKAIAREIGFPPDRFKASAKWLDKFKDRRKATGRPTMSTVNHGFGGYYPYTGAPYPSQSPMGGSLMLSRSQSSVTLSSSGSSGQEAYQHSPHQFQSPTFMGPPQSHIAVNKSEPDLSHIDTTPGGSRQRSQSSPQTLTEMGAMVSPSSGKTSSIRVNRPSPMGLQRQNSYQGTTSPSPRKPVTLTRTTSSQGTLKRSRPQSLAASAFGLTPLHGDEVYSPSPLNSPSTSASSGTHSRQHSIASLTPFTSSLSVMSISPDMSEGGDGHPLSMTVPPMTPLTPGQQALNGVFPNTDYGEIQTHQGPGGYQSSTMPNKHFAQPHYIQGYSQATYPYTVDSQLAQWQ
ncbi:hypothetical protein P7C73_g1051, partial [Tremellales sp. Uapishka_1]